MKPQILLLAALFGTVSGAFAQTAPVASFTVNDSTGCAPMTVHFTNTSINAVSYWWNFGNGNTSTLANPSVVFSSPGTYNITMIAYAGDGTSDIAIKYNYITVYSKPVANFSVPDNSGCEGGTPISFVNTSNNATNYVWDFGDGSTSTVANPSHIYNTSGTFTVILIAGNATGCSAVKVMNQYIVISPKPVVVFSVDKPTACSLDSLFYFSVSYYDASTMIWHFGDGSTSTQFNPAHHYNTPGTYNVSVVASNVYGCTDTIEQAGMVKVAQEIIPSFNVSQSNGCAPLTVSFTNTSVPLSGTSTWDFGDGSVSTQTNPSHTYNAGNTYNVTLTIKNSINCTYSVTSDSVIHVSDVVMADFSAGATTGCRPLTVNFSDNSTAATSWQWDFGDGITSTQQNPVHVYTSKGNFNVLLIAHNNNGCVSQKSRSNYIHVNAPDASFSASDSAGCAPLQVIFNAPSSTAVSWQWGFTDGGASSLRNPVHVFDSGGYYSATLIATDANGCSDTVSATNIIHVIPPIVYYTAPPPVISCSPITVTFNGAAIGKTFWHWDFGDGDTSVLANPVHVFNTPGTYPVSLSTIALNGCPVTIFNYNVYEIKTLIPDFYFQPDTCPSYGVQFTDSTPDIIAWSWNFGDGSPPVNDQNPYHVYSGPGSYNVSVSVTSADGCISTVNRYNYIFFAGCDGALDAPPQLSFGMGDVTGSATDSMADTVAIPIYGCAPFIISFTNPSDSAVSWLWDFGDGNFSAEQNPVHSYTSTGEFIVKVIATYSNGDADTFYGLDPLIIREIAAGFTVNQVNTCTGAEVSLTDTSTNASFWSWHFGDGATATDVNPAHTYTQAGNFLITETISDTAGCSAMAANNIYSSVVMPVFSYNNAACAGDTITFQSSITEFDSLLWIFGDGNTSTEEFPAHAYLTGGAFNLSMTVYDIYGCVVTYDLPEAINIYNPVAGFTLTSSNIGCNTLQVTFNNNTTGAAHFHWDFGDGSVSSAQFPNHIYPHPGTYHISLEASKEFCSSRFTLPDSIIIFPAYAAFSYAQTGYCLPVEAAFTDSSLAPVSWLWEFGDGQTSTLQNPVYTYTDFPTGGIKLTITDTNGCTVSAVKPKMEIFRPGFSLSAPQGCAPLTVSFADTTASALSWFWDFGDGDTSYQKNPVHTYSDTGKYSITLIAASVHGCTDTVYFPSLVKVQKVVAYFTSQSLLDACNPVMVKFTDGSLNATSWLWDFGDSNSSAIKNPTHIYIYPGKYSVALVASSSYGCKDTFEIKDFVNVKGPYAKFSIANLNGCPPLNVEFSNQSVNATTLTWYFDDGDTSHLVSPSHVFVSAGNYEITLHAEDTSGCQSTYTYPYPVTVYPLPDPGFMVSVKEGCQPVQSQFNSYGSDFESWLWDFGDDSFASGSQPAHTYNTAGTYYPSLVVTNIYGCSDTLLGQAVNVYPVPLADFSADITSGCAPLTVNFTNLSQNLNEPSYFWDFGNYTGTSDSSPVMSYYDNGSYRISLIVTNAHGCSDTAIKESYITAVKNPPPPPVDVLTVTVLNDTSVYMIWIGSDYSAFGSYRIYRKDIVTGQYEMAEEINDAGIISFTDEGLNTLENSYCYKIATVDTCGNFTGLDGLTEYCTINISARPVKDNITVEWNHYKGCNVHEYELLRNKMSSQTGWKQLAILDATSAFYEDTSWECAAMYSYKVIAKGLCGRNITSSSDTAAATSDRGAFATQRMEIKRTTVLEDNTTLTEWELPELAPQKITGYRIFRSEDNEDFRHLTTLPSGSMRFIDKEVDVNSRHYYYKVSPVYTCDFSAPLSNPGSSILLKAKTVMDKVNLSWNMYEEWEGGVKYYILERQREDGSWETVKVIDDGKTSFEDLVFER